MSGAPWGAGGVRDRLPPRGCGLLETQARRRDWPCGSPPPRLVPTLPHCSTSPFGLSRHTREARLSLSWADPASPRGPSLSEAPLSAPALGGRRPGLRRGRCPSALGKLGVGAEVLGAPRGESGEGLALFQPGPLPCCPLRTPDRRLSAPSLAAATGLRPGRQSRVQQGCTGPCCPAHRTPASVSGLGRWCSPPCPRSHFG